MTDKKLLQRLGEIVDQRMTEGLKPVNKRLDSIGEQLTEQGKRLDSVDKQVKTTNRRLRRVEKDVSYIAKNFDLEIVSNRRRIQKIENQLNISTPQQ